MPNITILSDEEAKNKEFNFLRKNGLGAKATDLYYLLGGLSCYIAKDDKETLINRLGTYWLKDDSTYDIEAKYIDNDGAIYTNYKDNFDIGCRPVVKYSEIRSESHNKKIDEEVLSVSYGEYPQYAISGNLKEEIEEKYKNNELITTGKKYTIYVLRIDDWDPCLNGYCEQELIEYIYNGKKYIRFEGLENITRELLSTKEDVEEGVIYWLEVKPIRWLVDIEKDVAISEKILLGGIQYYSEADRDWGEDREYKTSTINKFLNKYFSKEIIAKSRRKEKHKVDGVRKGIKIKKINVDKVAEIMKEEKKSIDKVKTKTKRK